jgi:large subunit ribosomal protein L2
MEKSTKKLTKKKPERKLITPLKKRGGRAGSGRVTVRHRGGGAKRLYRIIDFGQEKMNIPGKVIALEYDPNRTAFIALVEYEDGDKRYILAPQDLEVGNEIIIADKTDFRPANRMRLKNIPPGTFVYNIEIIPGRGSQLVRSAGTGAKVLAREGGYVHLEMPSKEIRKVREESFASIGSVSRPQHRFRKLRKAGRARKLGKRPEVRGAAMGVADHPHGGSSDGKSPIGLKYPKTPWGKQARGITTRRRKHTDKFIIQRRKKK